MRAKLIEREGKRKKSEGDIKTEESIERGKK